MNPTNTIHTRLQLHLERHMYRRGQYKGQAPADSNARGKNHFRVYKANDGTMRVHFWRTDLITAYPDGRIVLNTDGWHSRPTTVAAMSDALNWFGVGPMASVRFYRDRKFGISQSVLSVNREQHRYYDGIEVGIKDDKPVILSEIKPFEAKRIDRSESKELHDDMKSSGFKASFKLLHAVAKPEDKEGKGVYGNYSYKSSEMRMLVSDANYAEAWPRLIAQYTFTVQYDYKARAYVQHKHDAKKAWANLMAAMKFDLYQKVPAE